MPAGIEKHKTNIVNEWINTTKTKRNIMTHKTILCELKTYA
jgi:hypothetical protein